MMKCPNCPNQLKEIKEVLMGETSIKWKCQQCNQRFCLVDVNVLGDYHEAYLKLRKMDGA